MAETTLTERIERLERRQRALQTFLMMRAARVEIDDFSVPMALRALGFDRATAKGLLAQVEQDALQIQREFAEFDRLAMPLLREPL